MNIRLSLVRALMMAVVFGSLSGCSSIAYYSQSVIGHSRLMMAREPIEKAINQARNKENFELVSQLELAKKLRTYSVDRLALPDNSSYSSYVDLSRDFPVWTVVAAGEFSLAAKQWCYPIIGCASYRGYFSLDGAQSYADSLRESGLETSIGAVGAYSTLGWFDDPLLPSMMRYGQAELAETMFHELAHQQLYISGDSGYNEAFATVVGEQGTLRWIAEQKPELLADYEKKLAARDDFSNLIDNLTQRLTELYSLDEDGEAHANLNVDQLRAAKKSLIANFRNEYDSLKQNKWQGESWYEHWLQEEINNARLVAFGTYRDKVPEFKRLFINCSSNFADFYRSVEQASRDTKKVDIPTQCLN